MKPIFLESSFTLLSLSLLSSAWSAQSSDGSNMKLIGTSEKSICKEQKEKECFATNAHIARKNCTSHFETQWSCRRFTHIIVKSLESICQLGILLQGAAQKIQMTQEETAYPHRRILAPSLLILDVHTYQSEEGFFHFRG